MQDSATAAPEQLDEEFVQDPYAVFERLRVDSPVHPVVLPRGLRAWLVTRYADVRAALADPKLHKDSRRIGDLFERNHTEPNSRMVGTEALSYHMLNSDPPDHERLRRLVTKAFTARRIERMRPRIEEITAGLLAGIADRTEFDLLDEFAFPLPITVICELLGVPTEDRDDFRLWSNTLLSGGSPEEVRAAAGNMSQYLVDLVAGKRTAPGDDIVSALVQASDDEDRLSEREITAMAFLLLVAGHETTVNLIGNGILALMRNPEQFAALRADRSLLPGAIEEFLRYEGPVTNATLRYTTEPTEIGGVTVPAGSFVVLALGSANRDPDRYHDPDRLDVERDVSGHVAFGHGIHYCLGAPLARLEAEIAFTGLLDTFDRIDIAVPNEDLRWRSGFVIRGLHQLPVRVA
jgi:cytochrome P450